MIGQRPGGEPAAGVGIVRGTALFTAAVVGPGILTLPGLAARATGPSSLLVLAALLALSAPIASTFAAIHRTGTRGGIPGTTAAAFGPLAGRIAGAWFVYGVPAGVPALGLIAGGYVAQAVGGGRATALTVAAGITIGALVAGVLRRAGSGRVLLIVTALVVLLIVAAAALTVPHASTAGLGPVAPAGTGGVLQALLLLTWVLTGWEATASFAGVLRDPARTLRAITWLTLAVVTTLYLLVAVPQLLVLGPRGGTSDAPVAELLEVAIGPAGAVLAAAVAVAAATGNAIAYVASLSETGATREGLDPARGRVRARVLVVPAVLMVVALVVAGMTTLGVDALVAVTAGSQIPVYVLALASGLRLLPRWSTAWWTALAATTAVATLLVPAGPYLLVPTAIALGVVARGARRRAPSATARSHLELS